MESRVLIIIKALLCLPFHQILLATPEGRYYNLQFTDVETEAQRG